MMLPEDLAHLLAPLIAVQRLLTRFDQQGMVIGGVAASLMGKPRLTADVDIVLLLSIRDLPRLISAADEEGLLPRIAQAETFARRHRVLLLRHEASGINVDISLGMLPFEVEAVGRSIVRELGSLTIRLPTPEDLIILKAVAHRPQDFLDIRAMVETQPGLDRKRIRYWVREFAQALERPELWDDLAVWFED